MSLLADLTLPSEYGYVLLTTASTFFLGFWHGARVSAFRKPAGIPYPQHYAEKSDLSAASPEQKKALYVYNCAQRAHANYLENHPSVAISLLVAGLRWPVATTVLGVGWSVSRIAYAVGYTRADKENGKGRLIGLPFFLFQLGLFGMVGWCGAEMLM